MRPIAIGIDIGGTNTVFGLVDREGNCLEERRISTSEYHGVDAFLRHLFVEIDLLIEAYPDCEVQGIGIGAPNGNYYNGSIEFAPNLTWEGIVPLAERFEARYKLPAVLTNDANAAALGEMLFGSAKGMKHFIEITIGTGLGSGIVVNGEVLYGHDGFAGEIGHTIAKSGGRRCSCGRFGCLETYVSGRGMRQTINELLSASFEKSKLRDLSPNKITSKHVFEAAKKGDPIALEAFEYTGRRLGKALADTVAHLSPEAIFIFGGVARAGDLLLEPTIRHFEDNVLHIYKNKVKILPSGLNNRNAAILGAAALLWQHLDKQPHA